MEKITKEIVNELTRLTTEEKMNTIYQALVWDEYDDIDFEHSLNLSEFEIAEDKLIDVSLSDGYAEYEITLKHKPSNRYFGSLYSATEYTNIFGKWGEVFKVEKTITVYE